MRERGFVSVIVYLRISLPSFMGKGLAGTCRRIGAHGVGGQDDAALHILVHRLGSKLRIDAEAPLSSKSRGIGGVRCST